MSLKKNFKRRITGTSMSKNPEEPFKNRLLTDKSTTEEPIKSFINWYGYKKPCLKITSRGVQGGNYQQNTGCSRCSIQARKITVIKGSGIFYPEENKVDMIDDNLPSWV